MRKQEQEEEEVASGNAGEMQRKGEKRKPSVLGQDEGVEHPLRKKKKKKEKEKEEQGGSASSSLGNFDNQAKRLREQRSALASDLRFQRFINDFKSPDAFANALADESWDPLYEFPMVLEPPKNTSTRSRDTIHVQITESRADAIMHVLRAHEDWSPGAVFSGAQGTGKSILGYLLATHGFLCGWPTVYIVSLYCIHCSLLYLFKSTHMCLSPTSFSRAVEIG